MEAQLVPESATAQEVDVINKRIEDGVPNLDIAGAVKEMLQMILLGTTDPTLKLHLCLKSTGTSHSVAKTWFYIKISTSCAVKKDIFSDFSKSFTPALYHCLQAMQAWEDESHLCIQHPVGCQGQVELKGQGSNTVKGSSEGQRCVQINMVLKGENLEVFHEVQKNKPSSQATLHLRVHQCNWHMVRHCSMLHKYLCQVKTFRPQSDLSFTMKLGEAISHSSFSVEHWKMVSHQLPSLVTDSSFILHDSELIPVQPSTIPFCIGPRCMSGSGDGQPLGISMSEMHAVGQCVHVKGQGSRTGVITLTVFGPDYLPLDVCADGTRELDAVLHGIDWEKLFMKPCGFDRMKLQGSIPCHCITAVEPLDRHGIMDSFVAPVYLVLLTPNNGRYDAKNVSSRIPKLLCGYQQECTQSVEGVLEKVLQPVITLMKKHSTVVRSVQSVCKAVIDVMTLSDNDEFRTTLLNTLEVEDSVDVGARLKDKLMDISKAHHHGLWKEEDLVDQYNLAKGTHPIKGVNEDFMRYVQPHSSNVLSQRFAHRLPGYDMNSAIVDHASEDNAVRILNDGKVAELEGDAVALGSINELRLDRKEMQAARTAHEKDEMESDYLTDLSWNSNETGKSPELVDYVKDDLTPDVTQITAAMKDISPFQEFANTEKFEKKRDLESMPEDPFLNKKPRRRSGDNHLEETNSCEDLPEKQHMLVTCNNPRSLISPKSRQQNLISGNTLEPVSFPSLQNPSHEAILKSKDFHSTFEVVSTFIDDFHNCDEVNFSDVIAESVTDVANDLSCVGTNRDKDGGSNEEEDARPAVGLMMDDSDDWFDKVLMDVDDWLI